MRCGGVEDEDECMVVLVIMMVSGVAAISAVLLIAAYESVFARYVGSVNVVFLFYVSVYSVIRILVFFVGIISVVV